MSTIRMTEWLIYCNAPSCGAQYVSERDVTRAAARKILARRGWTTDDNSPALRLDYCPEHPAATP